MDIRVKEVSGGLRPIDPTHQAAIALLTGSNVINNTHLTALNLLGIELIENVSVDKL